MTLGIPCPHCGGHTEVKDSRPSGDASIRRRRRCDACGRRFTTMEVRVGDAANFLPAMDDYAPVVVKQAHELIRVLPDLSGDDRLILMAMARRFRGVRPNDAGFVFTEAAE